MCGINGILRLRPDAPPIDRAELLRTRDAMASRGPDGEGAWFSADGRVALGSRRLAILDLSPAGAQPMASPEGDVVVVVNGEIYNFLALREELEREGWSFRSRSDTEVVLALYRRHGRAMLGRLRGMFALALWDGRDGSLLLARDPLGIKPLYYALGGGVLRFASQVKALEAGGAVPLTVDPAGLGGFLLWGSVPEPWTFRRAVRALPAGHRLSVRDGEVEGPAPLAVAGEGAGDGRPHPEPGAATSRPSLAAALADSVAAHLVSDVPVAVFLSAGLDSCLVAQLACRALPEPPATFTLRFDALAGTPLDEGPLAALVARRLGTRHVERTVGREDFLGAWRAALLAMDQPTIDGWNVWLVARAAHEAGLKVALSGLGGDELFGSYPSFSDVPRLLRAARLARRLPGLPALWPPLARAAFAGRPKLAGALRHGATLPGAYFLRRALFLPEELPALLGRDAAAEALAAYDPVADAARALAEEDPGSDRRPPAQAAGRAAVGAEAAEVGTGLGNGHAGAAWRAVQRMETARYMRNQLLRDADWASMAHSIELRVPLVDAELHRRAAAAGCEPARSLGKAELVRRVAPDLPEAVLRRPKTGFYVPVTEWLAPDGDGARHGAAAAGQGGRARILARRVLAEFGVELAGGGAAA